MSSEKSEIMEDATAKEEVENTPKVTNNFRWYCCLEEAIMVFLRCLGFENHESAKSGEEKGVAVDSSSEKEGEKCEVNEPISAVQDSSSSNSGGATSVPAASTTDLGSSISVEDVARPPIYSGGNPQTN